MRSLFRVVRDNRAATAIEYGLVAALISVVAISSMSFLGKKLQNIFTDVTTGLSATIK